MIQHQQKVSQSYSTKLGMRRRPVASQDRLVNPLMVMLSPEEEEILVNPSLKSGSAACSLQQWTLDGHKDWILLAAK